MFGLTGGVEAEGVTLADAAEAAQAAVETLRGEGCDLIIALARLGVDVFPKSVYGLDQIPWRVLPSEVAGVAIAVVVFSTLAGIVPALIAARKDPVEALRG